MMPYALKCQAPSCTAVVTSDIPFSKNATYTCKEHTGKPPKTVHFERYQFDKRLDGGPVPQGTSHITFQGPLGYKRPNGHPPSSALKKEGEN